MTGEIKTGNLESIAVKSHLDVLHWTHNLEDPVFLSNPILLDLRDRYKELTGHEYVFIDERSKVHDN